jgi:hypothetical protein
VARAEAGTVRRAAVALACAVLGGCAITPGHEEVAFQTLSAIDTVQSLDISRHPQRWQEVDEPTRAILGAHPNEAQTVAWGIGRGAAHAAVTYALMRCDAPAWTVHAWEVVTIASEASTVRHNYRIGMQVRF